MERTKKIETVQEETSKKYWFKKVGGGVLYIIGENGKKEIIKPNQRFQAALDQIPKAFRDTVIPQEEIPTTEKKMPQPKAETIKMPIYSIAPYEYTEEEKAAEGFDETVELFNIVDAKGKVINGKPLAKEAAEQMIKDIMD
jgi:hypothetical protein